MEDDFEQYHPKQYIVVKNARVNNLKNLSVAIPRNQLVVITGVSGSGKSSLAFDTLYAEGQRMYVESLSSYARQFLSKMEKPDVDYIKGLSPAIAIKQKVNTTNTRSTVGTTTEIYDFLKLLYTRIGKTFSPISNREVKKHTVSNVCDFVNSFKDNERFYIFAPFVSHSERSLLDELNVLLQKGFNRVWINENIEDIEDYLKNSENNELPEYILIDRLAVKKDDEDFQFRLGDSVDTAFYEGKGTCFIQENGDIHQFSNRFELDGIVFEEPSLNFFTFNNPYGACKTCEGFGNVLGIDPDLVFPDKKISVFEGAIAPWRTDKMHEWLDVLIKNAIHFDFPIHRSFEFLKEEEVELLWNGNAYFKGLNDFFKDVENQSYKIQYRVMLSRYRGRTVCPDCKGTRLRKDAGFVKINNKSIQELVLLPIDELSSFFLEIKLTEYEKSISKRILSEINQRIDYLKKVGLGYLTLNRLSNSLSGGESQRINLATSIGSSLVGSMYILDEPSIGLHPKDSKKLVEVLKALRDKGNSVLVVEHDEETMSKADIVLDIGPEAGRLGGSLMFQGTYKELVSSSQSLTGKYLRNELSIPIPKHRRKWLKSITIHNATENNLKDVSVKIPLEVLTVVTGVSGSGKSTLIKKIFYPAIAKHIGQGFGEKTGKFKSLEGALNEISQVEFLDQNPIGKSSRSNPITYIKAYDDIRNLYASLPVSKANGYTSAYFSFNVDGGRCDTCKGDGEITIEMQFMSDIHLQCEECKGNRFKSYILEVKYKEKSIADVLKMTVDEAMDFFKDKPKIADKIKPLQDVGLNYIQLGQSSNTLSGGEAQRVKLASFLSKPSGKEKVFFIFDEPSTGLHFHDISKLMKSISHLVERGNSVLIIEHNLDIIKLADWIIDLGPEGGEKGGYVCFEGLPEDLVKQKNNFTAEFLKNKLV